MAERYVKRRTDPATVEAARYLHGQKESLDAIRAVVLLSSFDPQLVKVDAWRLVLVRTGSSEPDPFYEVVEDGTWLVYDPETGSLGAWDDEDFTREYQSVTEAANAKSAELLAVLRKGFSRLDQSRSSDRKPSDLVSGIEEYLRQEEG